MFTDKFTYVSSDAKVSPNVKILDRSRVCGTCNISGNVIISNNSEINDNANIIGGIGGKIEIYNSTVKDHAKIYGNSIIKDESLICDYGYVAGNTIIINSVVCENGKVLNNAQIDNAYVSDDAQILDNVKIIHNKLSSGTTMIFNNVKLYGNAIIFNIGYDILIEKFNICGKARISSKKLFML